jgi:voltage-gated potassium channel
MIRRTRIEDSPLFVPLVRSTVLVIFVFAVGVVGYLRFSGPQYDVLDALYMTVITLTTLGYEEVIPLDDHGRVFTIGLLLFGAGAVIYFFSTLTAFLVEGSLDQIFEERRMKRKIESMSDHYIVCGGGQTGQHIVREYVENGHDLVLIETDEERVENLKNELDGRFAWIIGDATEDDVLQSAGIERARGLASCVSEDNHNLIITFSARMLNSSMTIASRCSSRRVEPKIRRAGADTVIIPNEIGGHRLAAALARPTAMTFFDKLLRDPKRHLRIEDVVVEEGSSIVGHTLKHIRQRHLEDLLVIAILGEDEEWVYNPTGDIELHAGARVIFISGPETAKRLLRMSSSDASDI